MPVLLPPNPSLDQLRRQGRELLQAFREGEEEAFSRIQSNFPKLEGADETTIRASSFGLRDALLVISREYGFGSWPQLQAQLGGASTRPAPKRSEFHLEVQHNIHRTFADSCANILSEGTDTPFSVQLRDIKRSSLAQYHNTLVDEAYVFYVPQVRQYVHAACTYGYFMSPIESEKSAAELNFSMPLGFALRDLLTVSTIETERWCNEDEPYVVTIDEYKTIWECRPLLKLIKDLGCALATVWKPFADLEMTGVEFETVPAIAQVIYGIPGNKPAHHNWDEVPAPETKTHLADQVVSCEFDVEVAGLSETMSLHYERIGLEHLLPRIDNNNSGTN